MCVRKGRFAGAGRTDKHDKCKFGNGELHCSNLPATYLDYTLADRYR
jgi:hypothetical protein